MAALGLFTVLLPPYERPWWVVGLAALALVSSALVFVASRRRSERTWLDPLAAYLLFPFAGLVNDAAGAGTGGSSSGMTVLLLLPILWLANHRHPASALDRERPVRRHPRDPGRAHRPARLRRR